MPDASGCPKQLSVKEQVAWSSVLPHAREKSEWPVDKDLISAVQYEIANEPEDIDNMRNELAKRWVQLAASLESERRSLLTEAGFGDCKLRARIHYPLFRALLHCQDYPDKRLLDDLL